MRTFSKQEYVGYSLTLSMHFEYVVIEGNAKSELNESSSLD